MYGILEVGTGKVYAKSKKSGLDFQKLLQQIEMAYPEKKFTIGEVDNKVICVGDVPKTLQFERKGS